MLDASEKPLARPNSVFQFAIMNSPLIHSEI